MGETLMATLNLSLCINIKSNNKTIYTYIYTLPIAGQTAGPIGLNFLWTLMGVREWYKKFDLKFFYIFFSRATPGCSASHNCNKNNFNDEN